MAISMTQLLRKAAQSRLGSQSPTQPAAPEVCLKDAIVQPLPLKREQTNKADEQHRQNDQTKKTDKKNRQEEQTNSTVESIRKIQQTNSTVEQTKQEDKEHRQTDEPSTKKEHKKRTDKSLREGEQENKTFKINRQIKQTKKTDNSDRQTHPAMRLPQRLPLATAAQKTLAAHFLETGPVVTTYAVIAAETDVPMGTARTIINKFVAAGWLEKQQWGAGRNRALSLAPTDSLAATWGRNNADKSNTQEKHTNQIDKLNRQLQQLNQTVAFNRANAPLKIDRKNLSISFETLQTAWPTLSRAGFGLEQLEQIYAALAERGKSPERVVQGLDYAEWELAEGKMLDKTGQPVADPCAWVFRSLAGLGSYRRPSGYLSAEEQAEIDAKIRTEEMEWALARAREKARQERFRAWVGGLTRDAREKALEGRRGPEETWLRNVWAKIGEPD
ncbi:hypothetical protein GTA51_16185 [Desulfovibrio aerotolerans]|uniref:Uncharacterized protein n=1 Tax=Solidesulfovibrio aerotolerans TaxID=295255 RepID=A0A7C9NLB2_9BACT|nr:hypothetical protein [Solidesulfovibrio aerotolerans]MYL84656.1 hypothetical protein [Solidesulfovibrio aerotolerans]